MVESQGMSRPGWENRRDSSVQGQELSCLRSQFVSSATAIDPLPSNAIPSLGIMDTYILFYYDIFLCLHLKMILSFLRFGATCYSFQT